MNMFLIDTSYVTYHCMFSAAKAVYGKSDLVKLGYAEDYDPLTNDDYVEALYEKFTNVIDYREKVCKCDIPISNVVFAIDCKRHEIWRKEIFPDYKAQRDEKTPLFNTGPSKQYILDVIIPIYVEQGAIALQIPKAEADDIVGIIVEANREVDMHHVISSDKDYLQLSGKNYRQYDANGGIVTKVSLFKDVAKSSRFKDRDFSKEIVDLQPKDLIFFKTLMGDKSDNINPIHKGCGPVKAYTYLRNNKLLQEQVNGLADVKKQLVLNTRMMNFKFIPKDIQDEIIYWYSKERSER